MAGQHCTCPKDGSNLCPWCTAMLARATGIQAPVLVPLSKPLLPPVLYEERRNSPYWPYRSKTEQRYAAWLSEHQQAGGIIRWRYEALRLRLAPATAITVDFEVIFTDGLGDGRIQLHEVKGGWYREDGWQKLKTAATLYPEFRFFRVQWQGNQWQWLEIPAV